MLLSGRREADILRGGGREAADEEGGERAGDGGDEDIYPEGEMAEGTEEGCAADWHGRVLTGGLIWDYIVRSYGYFCVSPVGYLGLYAVGGYNVQGYGYSHADSGVASERLFRRCKRVSVGIVEDDNY